MITLGVDVGSLFTKGVLLQGDDMLASLVWDTTGNISREMDNFIDEIAKAGKISRSSIEACVSTGTGDDLVQEADFTEDEVACLAMATRVLIPDVELTVDIGGQSITNILSDPDGEVLNFMHNDKCASGSGRFIEVISDALGVEMSNIDATVNKAAKKIPVSTQCAVFAESEIVSYVNEGESVPDIITGVCEAVARIVVSQVLRLGAVNKFTVTGGVARIQGVTWVLDERIPGEFVTFPIDPGLAGAYGAALLAQMEE